MQATQITVIYDKGKRGYRLTQLYDLKLANSEILATCKILLDSRSLPKKEMEGILKKLIVCCVPKNNQGIVNELINNELFHYTPPRHNKNIREDMWSVAQVISQKKYLEIEHTKQTKEHVKCKLTPPAIVFSEFYFYMLAFLTDKELTKNFRIKNDTLPNIFRLDRINQIHILDEKYYISYDKRFSEGEFRKRILMYGGEHRKVVFQYKGPDIINGKIKCPLLEGERVKKK